MTMQTVDAFVRPAPLNLKVTPEEFDRLVSELISQRTEIEFREAGTFRHGQFVEGLGNIAAGLARRNVRSLLARVANPANVRAAINLALTGEPEDAEDALEEAGIELNLRFVLFATDAAKLSIDNDTLTIEDAHPATHLLRKTEYRRTGREVFCTEALFRLLYSRIDCVKYSSTAILPVSAQLARSAVALGTDELAKRVSDWRTTRKPHFVKEFCVSCGSCFAICLNDAIERAGYDAQTPEASERLGINYDRCRGCGLCAASCPGDAHGRKAVVMVRACEEGSPEMHCLA
jgi:Pyruvate/2-oxoacid:ferredoxin oxidoreductase delta subunit